MWHPIIHILHKPGVWPKHSRLAVKAKSCSKQRWRDSRYETKCWCNGHNNRHTDMHVNRRHTVDHEGWNPSTRAEKLHHWMLNMQNKLYEAGHQTIFDIHRGVSDHWQSSCGRQVKHHPSKTIASSTRTTPQQLHEHKNQTTSKRSYILGKYECGHHKCGMEMHNIRRGWTDTAKIKNNFTWNP